MLLLTNCTLNSVVYDVRRVMEECLAIKPDLVFLWDEAWFAFARFHPVYRPRTAMRAARTLAEKLQLQVRERHQEFAERALRVDRDNINAEGGGSSRRPPGQGLLDSVHPQDADLAAAGLHDPRLEPVRRPECGGGLPRGLHDAHLTSRTQILASLDLGRRQAALEGFELVVKQIEARCGCATPLTTTRC